MISIKKKLEKNKNNLEKKECHDGRGLSSDLFREVERTQKGRGVQECREESQDREDVKL
jgi:hypothetical protein